MTCRYGHVPGDCVPQCDAPTPTADPAPTSRPAIPNGYFDNSDDEQRPIRLLSGRCSREMFHSGPCKPADPAPDCKCDGFFIREDCAKHGRKPGEADPAPDSAGPPTCRVCGRSYRLTCGCPKADPAPERRMDGVKLHVDRVRWDLQDYAPVRRSDTQEEVAEVHSEAWADALVKAFNELPEARRALAAAIQRAEEAERELEKWRKRAIEAQAKWGNHVCAESAEALVRELAEALERFGWHANRCAKVAHGAHKQCDCGFRAALARVPGVK